MKIFYFLLAFLLSNSFMSAQVFHDEHNHTDHTLIYNWDWKKDGYILGGSFLGWATSRYLKGQVNPISLQDLSERNPENLLGIDRGAINNSSEDAQQWSDVFLYSSFLLPISHYTGMKCRSQGFVIGGMALETFFITDGITNTIKAITKRFRPFTYNTEIPDEERLVNGARFSFISGHSSNTAALGFFSAKVYSDLYPDSKWKPLIWTLGVTLPAMTGYLRYRAGKHFPTDIIGGYVLGASVGYLVPHFHKISNDNLNLNLVPINGGLLFSLKMILD